MASAVRRNDGSDPGNRGLRVGGFRCRTGKNAGRGRIPLQKNLVRIPTASGTVTYGNDTVSVDASNVQNGYVMVKYTGSVGKIKVQISKGDLTYTYDLNARDAYEVFPMSEGSGTYKIKVFENVSGTQYSQAFSQDVPVSLADQFEPFLYPNQYVNFSQGSAAVQKGAQLAAGAKDDLGVVDAIYNYVVDNLTYDKAKALTMQPLWFLCFVPRIFLPNLWWATRVMPTMHG